MAKNRAPSRHSRAARRATSPSIDTDKSIKDFNPSASKASSRQTLRPNILSLQRSAGVTKKQSKRKSVLSSKARKRYEKGLRMAEAIEDRTRSKVERSHGREKVVRGRRKAWEDINKEAGSEEAAAERRTGMFAVLANEEEDGQMAENGDDEDAWETDEEMDTQREDEEQDPESAARTVAADLGQIL